MSEPDAAQVKQAAMELLQLTDTLVQELLTEDHPGPIVTSIAIYLGKLSDSIKEFDLKTADRYATAAFRVGRIALIFYNLSEGIVDQAIAAAAKKQKTRTPTIVLMGRMRVALAYECFHRAGMSHPAVAEEIAKHRSLRSLLHDKRSSLTSSPKSWWDQFFGGSAISGGVKDRAVRQAFKRAERALGLDGLAPDRCVERGQQCLARAAMIAGILGIPPVRPQG